MDYGGTDRRRTKKDLKRKRLARGYKRGGQFRTHNVSKVGEGETGAARGISPKKGTKVPASSGKKKVKKKRKY